MKGTITHIPGVVTAVVVGATPDGRPIVRWASAPEGRQGVQSVWMDPAPDWAQCAGLRVVLGFEDGDEARPIVLGLLDGPPGAARQAKPAGSAGTAGAPRPKVLKIESEQELILECGEAKIALRADGRVTILGGYVLSRSKGVNKIKGGTVQIN